MSSQSSKKQTGSSKPSEQTRNAKKKQIDHLIQKMSIAVPSDEDLVHYASCMVDPRGSEGAIMPSPTPTRAGVAKFPLVFEVTTPTDFGIIVRPDFERPVSVFSGDAASESNNAAVGSFELTHVANTYPYNLSMGRLNSGPSNAEQIGGAPAFPLQSASGCTLTVTFTMNTKTNVGVGGSGTQNIRVLAYDGSAWVTLGTTDSVPTVGSSVFLAGLNWTASFTHITFLNVITTSYLSVYDVEILPTIGTFTLQPLGNVSSGVVHLPNWASLLQASKRARVVACDCLVTFEGSALANGGSIAVCNTDDDLVISSSFYETIAAQPFDMYRGRLASQGETEGGAHWHYIPDTPEQFSLRDLTSEIQLGDQVPEGYFGIKGKAANEVVRVECHFVVNFFSADPSYHMEITPCFSLYPKFLWCMRDLIPLVSSNDSHLKKLKRLGKAGLRKGVQAAQFAQNHEADIAKALGLMATLL